MQPQTNDEPPATAGPAGWQHATIAFPRSAGMSAATAASLHAELERAIAERAIAGYHFLRKGGKLRLRVTGDDEAAAARLAEILDTLTVTGAITGWTPGIYEPEIAAFGGPAAMTVAHQLFRADSRAALALAGHPRPPGAGPRERAVLLVSTMIRSAGLDWFEMGDVWAKVSDLRSGIDLPGEDHRDRPVAAMGLLMQAEATAISEPGPCWAERVGAFAAAGRDLRALADQGELSRGLRAVLAHHAIFAFNRAGLTAAQQAALARLATAAVFAPPDASRRPGTAITASVGHMKTPSFSAAPPEDPAASRHRLVQSLLDAGRLRSPRIADALTAVDRHLFVPEATIADAYADDAVPVKRADDGTVISAASMPSIVAAMLEQLDPRPGEKILEAGAATGYNAALLGRLVEPGGHVWTIDVDEDLIGGARRHLTAAGAGNVTAVLGDGAAGLPGQGPFNRIIFTVGAGDVPAGILGQLAPGGRLLIPLRVRGGVSRAIAFEREGSTWAAVSSEMATFMPLRKGIADDARVITPLTADGAVSVHTYAEQDIDPEAIAVALDHPAHETRTGVKFRKGATWEWVNLWLTCALPYGICRMPATGPLVESGQLRPQFPWGAMAAVHRDTIAYLTLREGHDQDGPFWEAGVIGHGPRAAQLDGEVSAQIQAWAAGHRDTIPTIRLATGAARSELTGRFVIDKRESRLAIDWD
jgi:protein-L-isoaspartate(D-aspartate) O-methyltransferase